jgi:hypothetical protein
VSVEGENSTCESTRATCAEEREVTRSFGNVIVVLFSLGTEGAVAVAWGVGRSGGTSVVECSRLLVGQSFVGDLDLDWARHQYISSRDSLRLMMELVVLTFWKAAVDSGLSRFLSGWWIMASRR